LLPDLGIAGKVVDIDGQGLVSKEGLAFIWRNIELSKASSDLDIDLTNSSCPNTGFQRHDTFCKKANRELILNEWGSDKRSLAAAILYEQSVRLYEKRKQSRPRGGMQTTAASLSFVWSTAKDYSWRITCDAANESDENGKLAVSVMDQDMARLRK
jgi:hypothetical protein